MVQAQAGRFVVKGPSLYRRLTVDGYDLLVPYLKLSHRPSQMAEIHQVLGHLKSPSAFKSLQLRWWWPGMQADFAAYISQCPVCQLHDSDRHSLPHPMHPLPDPGIPFHTWHLDWIQDLPVTPRGNSQIAVAMCKSTRTTVALAFPNRTTASCLSFFDGAHFAFRLPFGGGYGSRLCISLGRLSTFLLHQCYSALGDF
jgi:hypothetical protein